MNILAKLERGILTRSARETRELAGNLAAILPPDSIIALHGDLGVGKTTFIQGLAEGFGIEESITSPTFNIYSIHQGEKISLVHLDAYRLDGSAQLDALMLEDFLVSPYCLAVEWPENIADWLPPHTWHLRLGILKENEHSIQLDFAPLHPIHP